MVPFSRGSLLLAPMVGITNRAFRALLLEGAGAGELAGAGAGKDSGAESWAPDYAFTEMASAEAFISGAQYEDCYTDASPLPRSTSVQFFARTARDLGKACGLVAGRDEAARPAGIDINFGCSAPHIRKAGGGSAWSADPHGAAELVSAARDAWNGALSAKVRMGADDEYERFRDFCATISAAGLDFIVIHPRTDSQKFRKIPRYDFIGRLARDLPIPVVGNGDIVDYPGLARLRQSQNPFAVMIGREAVRRPWIFALLRVREYEAANNEAPRPIRVDRLETGLRFLDLVDSHLPEPWKRESSRRFFSYYCDTLSFAHHIKYRILNSPTLDSMRERLTEYFEQVPADRHLSSG